MRVHDYMAMTYDANVPHMIMSLLLALAHEGA